MVAPTSFPTLACNKAEKQLKKIYELYFDIVLNICTYLPINTACSITSLSGVIAFGIMIADFNTFNIHWFISLREFLIYRSSIIRDILCKLDSANLFNCPLTCFSNRVKSLLS